MKYKEVMVGRSETLPLEQFHSMKLYNQITVEVCESDSVQVIAEKLHSECKNLLDEQKKRQGLPFTPASVKTENEFRTGDEILKERNDKNDGNGDNNGNDNGNGDSRDDKNGGNGDSKDEHGDAKVEFKSSSGGNGGNGNGGPWDKRNRNLKQLLGELNIRSVSHANFLRWQEEISYKEWQRLHDYFNGQEINEMIGR
ncbi:MAG: hypothetical protein QMC80_01625 [Thermoplasmatales archaeon]|nr:hypothetical protein [Thermoplasmatales archaeon]